MTNSLVKDTAANQVWNNSLIMVRVIKYLKRANFAPMCLSCKLGWLYGTEAMWGYPKLQGIKGFNRFADTITRKPPLQLGSATCYGAFVKTLDLSVVGGRKKKINISKVASILAACTNLDSIDLSLCQSIEESQLFGLFRDNSRLHNNLVYLTLDKMKVSDEVMGRIVRLLPKLQFLQLSETYAGPLTCKAIGSCLSGLLSLEVTNCKSINDDCLVMIARGCRLLRYISIEGCIYITSHDVEGLMLKHGCHPRISEDDHGDYVTYVDYDEDLWKLMAPYLTKEG
ncbi:hypothetical protein LPJ59_004551 [Coemansia sp. RSA 2399]|nr:hypothetical protein LPJ59_004551 [Coemansia sp. RSA 2399]KAJ1898589.1 hypothetical protein LPJ81_004307 [Coemansia sp. IMI 209127]